MAAPQVNQKDFSFIAWYYNACRRGLVVGASLISLMHFATNIFLMYDISNQPHWSLVWPPNSLRIQQTRSDLSKGGVFSLDFPRDFPLGLEDLKPQPRHFGTSHLVEGFVLIKLFNTWSEANKRVENVETKPKLVKKKLLMFFPDIFFVHQNPLNRFNVLSACLLEQLKPFEAAVSFGEGEFLFKKSAEVNGKWRK